MKCLKKNIVFMATAISLLFVAGFSGCKSKPPPPPVSVSISPTTANIVIGESRTFNVTTQNTDFTIAVSAYHASDDDTELITPASDDDIDCVKSGNAITCTPTTTGEYIVTATATADRSKQVTVEIRAVPTPEVLRSYEEIDALIEAVKRRREERAP